MHEEPYRAGFTPTVQVMDRTPNADEEFARVAGPTCCFGGCSELCCDQPFAVKRVGKDGSVMVDIGDVATITKKKPKSLSTMMREMLTDSDLYELEIHDTSITPQQRATLIGTLLMLDYMFFERDIDMCGIDGNGKPYINLCNCYMCGAICPCQLKAKGQGGGN